MLLLRQLFERSELEMSYATERSEVVYFRKNIDTLKLAVREERALQITYAVEQEILAKRTNL